MNIMYFIFITTLVWPQLLKTQNTKTTLTLNVFRLECRDTDGIFISTFCFD
jgi:hypothetical protein